ncbi:hypothetical protein GUITHDRAFT_151399 [Guillardia theta CCMP2712]|uniref:SHSP domain-containing protein n=3 Tax=Guillardia theta TaxID=55529 RepID=L1JN80_GUITC|nr:hypothetical protein GUITHDRAFT_104490 [Guillardia theta CCMP2712]XP_005836513.1 hypothetical protein GUITHDRAFT_151399 [Guillardia theta CCMP2712]EKX49528.1 hypothetical protein GUITHDRAFT_104490 [Guillardia theta CCMP2712]EKX49533.1 hypothetical protein GUITHDRAFT_151399 [Guillardia theta CCMP2712]|eukprot:XP_005836508.1 hypothetical protein GUITHDRAFT_104490 [Guillardia theta CCMP2712]
MLSLLAARPLDMLLAPTPRLSYPSVSLLSDLDSVWDDLQPSWYDRVSASRLLDTAAMPRIESRPDRHVVTMDTPGVPAGDLALSLVGDRTLELVASSSISPTSAAADARLDDEAAQAPGAHPDRSSLRLRQRIVLPADCDPGDIRSEYCDGQLRIEVARRQPADRSTSEDDELSEEARRLKETCASKRARVAELTEELRRERRDLVGLESELRAAREEARRKRSTRRTPIAIQHPTTTDRAALQAPKADRTE